jgi:hypothetical protein
MVYETQPQNQPAENQQPVPKKSNKLVLTLFMLSLLLIVAGVAAYLMSQEEDPTPVETNQTSQETQEEPAEEVVEEVIFESTLYPDLSFIVPEGWEVTEPETYEENAFGEGSADGVITVTKEGVTMKLDFVTVFATGFEGYSCYNHEGLTAVGGVYRFVDSEGVIVYEAGISEADEDWGEVIAQEGEFTTFEDPDPNYCVSFPFIGTYSSTLNQADYPDQPYGFTDKEKAIVWMSAAIEGEPTEVQQKDADEIIKSLSQPDLGV